MAFLAWFTGDFGDGGGLGMIAMENICKKFPVGVRASGIGAAGGWGKAGAFHEESVGINCSGVKTRIGLVLRLIRLTRRRPYDIIVKIFSPD
jgi:hypothetical protein